MKCFDCLRSNTSSPDIQKAQAAPLATASPPSPTGKSAAAAVGVARADPQAPRRKAKFASFDEVLKSTKAMEALREYMTNTQQEQLLDFLVDVQRYRSDANQVSRKQQAQSIFNTYLKVLADREISVDGHIRTAISGRIADAPPDLYNAAEAAVLEEIRRDVFPRFLQTPLFEKLAGLSA